jgi:hypothetical protein
MPHHSRRGDKRVEMGHRPWRGRSPHLDMDSHMDVYSVRPPARRAKSWWGGVCMHARTYGQTNGRNERPYVMRWENFAPFGADAQKEAARILKEEQKKVLSLLQRQKCNLIWIVHQRPKASPSYSMPWGWPSLYRPDGWPRDGHPQSVITTWKMTDVYSEWYPRG